MTTSPRELTKADKALALVLIFGGLAAVAYFLFVYIPFPRWPGAALFIVVCAKMWQTWRWFLSLDPKGGRGQPQEISRKDPENRLDHNSGTDQVIRKYPEG